MKLLRNINKFYKKYDLEHPFDPITMTKDDMYDHNALMTAYESLWLTMEHYDEDSAEYQWMSDLYGELGDYITYGGNSNVDTIVKLIAFILGIFFTGVFTAVAIEYGLYLIVGAGIVLGIILAVCSGIALYQNIKE